MILAGSEPSGSSQPAGRQDRDLRELALATGVGILAGILTFEVLALAFDDVYRSMAGLIHLTSVVVGTGLALVILLRALPQIVVGVVAGVLTGTFVLLYDERIMSVDEPYDFYDPLYLPFIFVGVLLGSCIPALWWVARRSATGLGCLVSAVTVLGMLGVALLLRVLT
jgi:hypothetical protein